MTRATTPRLAPDQIGVKSVPTNNLNPNPHNPRMLFDKIPMNDLRDSIERVGILVPLTVYESKDHGNYIILDGQRRWMCAQDLKLKQVPVNVVAEPSLVQNIVTMFQIHKLREDWELMPTALKLEVLIRELKDNNEKRLAVVTGLDPSVISRCKRLLSYSKKYKDLMLDPNPEKRVKADFFIEMYAILNDRTVNKMSWYTKEAFIKIMLNKYLNRKSGIKAVTDFRIMKQHINNARRAKKIKGITRRLEEFINDDTLTLDHLRIEGADLSASARKLISMVNKLEVSLHNLNTEDYYGEKNLWESLERVQRLITLKLKQAGRRSK